MTNSFDKVMELIICDVELDFVVSDPNVIQGDGVVNQVVHVWELLLRRLHIDSILYLSKEKPYRIGKLC